MLPEGPGDKAATEARCTRDTRSIDMEGMEVAVRGRWYEATDAAASNTGVCA
ncbi:hypothetical protein GCM10010331_34630 [Streptomyces xanthochromogenes]|nr:hypothetical protein GCM10010331_34630 [Streptomyces xanthochromogenes]